MSIKAFGYVRVSSTGQEKGHGPERQKELISGCPGYEIAGWYDDSFTGTEAERPAFMAMLEAMMGNGVRVVVVESLDRFSRDLMVQCTLLAKLASEGITLIAANTGDNITESMEADPMRRGLVQIQGVLAELDRNMTVRRMRLGREAKKAKDGRCEGNVPYGVRPGEYEIAVRIKKLRQYKEFSYGRIAKTLNADGVSTRGGGLWKAGTVQGICKRRLAQQPEL